jgi:tetratricopeptide (TPR) repeat protein
MNLKSPICKVAVRLCGIVFLLFLQASTIQAQSKKKKGETVSEQDQIKATYAFFDAQKEKLTGNDARAAEQFSQCLRLDPLNHAAMYELASIYSSGGRMSDALFLIRQALELEPKNEWYSLLYADILERSGKYNDAVEVYRKLYQRKPAKVEYLFSEADVLLMQGKLAEAIKVYDRIELVIGVSQEMSQQKQRLYLKLGKTEEAALELEKLIRTEPNNMEYHSLLVELWQVNERPQKAMEVIRRMQEIDPESPNVYLCLAEQYRMEGKRNESYAMLKKAFASPALPSEIKIRILTSYLPLVSGNTEMMQQSLELGASLSSTHPNEALAQTVYGDFLYIDQQYAPAREQYRKGLSIDKRNLQAWQQLLLTESELKDYPAMAREAEEALGYFSDQAALYLFAGIGFQQQEEYAAAATKYLSGSKLVVDNDALLVDFYSNLGDCYDKLKRYSDSDTYFQKALNTDKDNVFVLNNWAYYLSLRNEQLEKAAEMSRRSNQLSPGNPSFEDTYGWILFIQGDISGALEWLSKAIASGGNTSGTVLEHYGDALFRAGRTDDALKYWQQAREAGGHSDQLERKLRDKKL